MRRVVAAVGLLLALAHPAKADTDLTLLINTAYPPRTEDPALHDTAHQRAVEISTDFSHRGQRSGTAEVLAFNQFFADPIAHVLSQWQGSPDHDAILSDPSYTRIGCAEYVTPDETHWFACVLAVGVTDTSTPSPTIANPLQPANPVPALPNTALRLP